MDRTAQALEIAKCLDALPCKWGCVTTFNRTIDDRDYLFNLFSRDASIEVIAAFPLEFSESRRRYYESMAEDFTARAETGRFYVAGGQLRLSVSTRRRGEDDVVPAEGVDYLLRQCFSLIERFAPEVFAAVGEDAADDEGDEDGTFMQRLSNTFFSRMSALLGLEQDDETPSEGGRTHDKN